MMIETKITTLVADKSKAPDRDVRLKVSGSIPSHARNVLTLDGTKSTRHTWPGENFVSQFNDGSPAMTVCL